MSRKHINLYTLKRFEKALNAEEKQQIVQNLVKGRTPSQIAKNLQRDTRTIQKFIRKIVYKDKDINRALSRREISRVLRRLRKKPSETSLRMLVSNASHVLLVES